MINRNFRDFKFQHKRNQNQVLFISEKIKSDQEILNLIDNFLTEKNSFIFESVEKGIIKGRYTIFGKNPDKVWEFNNKNSIIARSGKNKYKFDISQESFAWLADDKEEKKMIKAMKRGSRIMITGYNQEGSQTIDHYSLLGFTKAYGAAKKSCS